MIMLSIELIKAKLKRGVLNITKHKKLLYIIVLRQSIA